MTDVERVERRLRPWFICKCTLETAMTADSPLALWRAANDRATQAENEAFEAAFGYVSGHGPMPDPQLELRARALRAEASARLNEAIQFLRAGPGNPKTRQGTAGPTRTGSNASDTY